MKIIQAGGQTCNKFWIYANYLADSIQTGERIVIFSPDIQIKDYPNLLNCKSIVFPFFFNHLSNLVGYQNYIKFLQSIFENNIAKKILKFLFFFIPSIDYINATVGVHASQNLNRERKTISKYFLPNEDIRNEVTLLFDSLKVHPTIVCGIHIRRGDYNTFKDGRYYYKDIQYLSIMRRMKMLFSDQRILFFISSNEKIDLSVFSEYECFINKDATPSKDLFGLSICDFIIGPPSTFSGWASYCGNIPLYFIEDPKIEFNLSSFKDIMRIWYLKVPL